MTENRISATRALTLIVRLKWARLSNQIAATMYKKKRAGKRAGTAQKTTFSAVRAASLAIIILLTSGMMSYLTIHVLEEKIEKSYQTGVGTKIEKQKHRLQPEEIPRSRPFLEFISFITALWFIVLLLISMGYQNKEMARLDADVEWLLTFPVTIPLIYLSKILERTVYSLGWLLLMPLYVILLWNWGYRWSIPFIAVGLTLIINFVIAFTQFSLEIFFRRILSTYSINNVQAVATVLGAGLLGIASNFSIFAFEFYGSASEWCQAVGRIALFLPTGLGLGFFQGGGVLWMDGLHLAEVGLVAVAGWNLINWASRHGLETVQSPQKGRRGKEVSKGRRYFTGIISKDLLMLKRDKALLVQLGLPLVTSIPLIFMPGFLTSFIKNPTLWGSFAFITGAFPLMATAPGVLIHEGSALWLLYTFPRSLLRIVLMKTRLWVVLAWLLSFTTFGIGIFYRRSFHAQDLLTLFWIIVGIPIYGIICSSMGVLGTDSFATEKQKRLREDLMAIVLLFGVLLAGGMNLPGLWGKFCCLVLYLMLALAWWQKAEAHIDFHLDPTAVPAPRIHFADGLTAVVLFILLQSLSSLLLILVPFIPQPIGFIISYLFAGGLTIAVVISNFRGEGIKIRETIPFLSYNAEESRKIIITTLIAAAIVSVIGAIGFYLSMDKGITKPLTPNSDWEMILLFVLSPLFTLVLKPVMEETLYRGLVFNGVRESMGFIPSALISAALFAMLQPPLLAIPVFLAGIVLAWAYNRSGILIVPILVNAIFNGVIFFLQILMQSKGI